MEMFGTAWRTIFGTTEAKGEVKHETGSSFSFWGLKRGQYNTSWRRRYFCAHEDTKTIKYFKRQSDMDHQGTIRVVDVQSKQEQGGAVHLQITCESGRIFTLCLEEKKMATQIEELVMGKETAKKCVQCEERQACPHSNLREEDIEDVARPSNRLSLACYEGGGFRNSVFRPSVACLKNEKIANLQLEDLEIMSTLGRGTYGEVLLVKHKPTEEIMALKGQKKTLVVEFGQQAQVLRESKVYKKICGQYPPFPLIGQLLGTFKDEEVGGAFELFYWHMR
jgi:hypothetical protein